MTKRLTTAVMASIVLASTLVAAEPGPSKDIPELAPLNNWAGAWTGHVEKPVSRSGPSNGKWITAGRYLQQTWKIEAGDNNPAISATVIMTWDVDKKVYRRWQFMSNGSTTQAIGQGDAKTRTMTWTDRRPDGVTVVSTARFPNADLQLWTITGTDREGNSLFEMSGDSKRRKK